MRSPFIGEQSGVEGTEVTEVTGSHREAEERRVARDSGPAQPAPHATKKRGGNAKPGSRIGFVFPSRFFVA